MDFAESGVWPTKAAEGAATTTEDERTVPEYGFDTLYVELGVVLEVLDDSLVQVIE